MRFRILTFCAAFATVAPLIAQERAIDITFRSSRVEKLADGQWKVDGDLSLHGVTKPVSLTVKLTDGAYTTHTVLKQTDFGIKPISIGGGMIKVKNEVEIDFRILARPA